MRSKPRNALAAEATPPRAKKRPCPRERCAGYDGIGRAGGRGWCHTLPGAGARRNERGHSARAGRRRWPGIEVVHNRLTHSRVVAIGIITPSMLNAMPVDERVKALNEMFPAMERWAAQHIPYFRWNRRDLIGTTTMIKGSCCFAEFDDRLFFVTAALVYDGFLEDQQKSGAANTIATSRIFSSIRKQGCVATTAVLTSLLSYDELRRSANRPYLVRLGLPPSQYQNSRSGSVVSWESSARGFGAHGRALACVWGTCRITTVTDRQITCRFDRQFIAEGRRTAPVGMNMGEMSGGPLLLPLGNDQGSGATAWAV